MSINVSEEIIKVSISEINTCLVIICDIASPWTPLGPYEGYYFYLGIVVPSSKSNPASAFCITGTHKHRDMTIPSTSFPFFESAREMN